MKMNYVKLGTIVKNKVDGKNYMVTHATKDPETTTATTCARVITGARATTFDPKTKEPYGPDDEQFGEVMINEQNAICFRAIHIPEDTDVPTGYSVTDGKLYKDDAPVTEQGQLVIKSIIATLPGYLVLAVEPRQATEGFVDLFAYLPEKDEFRKLINASIPWPSVVRKLEDAVVLGYNHTHMEKVLDENGKETDKKVEIFDGASLMLVANKHLDSVRFDRPIALELIPVLGSPNSYLVGSTYEVDDHGAVTDGKIYYEKVTINGDNEMICSDVLDPQPYASVESASVVQIYDMDLMLKGADFIQYKDLRIDSPLIGEIEGNYLIDITRGDHEVTVTLADEDYNTYVLNRKSTRDRGYIVSRVK